MRLWLAGVAAVTACSSGATVAGVPAVAPAAPSDTRSVVYYLTGSAGGADITYNRGDSGTEQQAGVAVPMANDLSGAAGMRFDASPGSFLYFSAQNTGESGSLTCEIVEDGRVVDEHTSDGGFTIVTCQGTA